LGVENGDLVKLSSLFLKQLAEAGKKTNLSNDEESRCIGVISFFKLVLAATPELAHDANFLNTAQTLQDSTSEKFVKAANNVLFRAAVAVRFGNGKDYDTKGSSFLKSLYENTLTLEEDDESMNGKAIAVGIAVAEIGPEFCGDELAVSLAKCLEHPKKTGPLIGAMRIVMNMTKEAGALVMPYLNKIDVVGTALYKIYDKVSTGGRTATKKALMQMMEKLDNHGVRVCVPHLLDGLSDSAWRIKQLSLQLLGALAKRQVPDLFRDLPIIVPAVMECVRDTKKQVGDAAIDCLDNLGSCITNPETVKLLPWLLEALKDPEKVEFCLDELMDMTFVNSIDAKSLCLIIPVVLRGIREGSAEVKLKGSITAGNVCSLVADVHDMRPFYSILMPELNKLLEHSRPRVREMAKKAKESLMADLAMIRRGSSKHESVGSILDDSIITTFESKLVSLLDVRSKQLESYVVESCKMLIFDFIEDVDQDMPNRLLIKHVRENTISTIKPLFANPTNAFLDSIVDITVDALWAAFGKSHDQATHDTDAEKDYIVYLPTIILAFASRLLLKRTGLFLERNHRYGFVGMNGVGKTTLLNRIAARDIYGFPDDIICYYVQHEIMDEDAELTVEGYMHRELDLAKNDNAKIRKEGDRDMDLDIKNALDEVGFTQTLREAPVASLSGGWRMRLAISRSMLYNADLLLLDEPTNHLDAKAIVWLENYLTGLTNTTIGVVSHDYEFMDNVVTDIIHIADLKLGYYPCGFKEFQKQRPEVVAALPKKDDGSGGNSALDFLSAAANGDESAAALVANNIKPVNFPEGSKLEGIIHRGKPIATMTNVVFSYPGTTKTILKGLDTKLTLNSRVALLGPNGAGKSTLLKLLVGETEINEDNGDTGKVWKHHNLRTAYIAQHSMHHLEDHIEMTPCQYIQSRFWEGQDKETSKLITVHLTDEDKEAMSKYNEINAIESRVNRNKKLFYEIRKAGREETDGSGNPFLRQTRKSEYMSLDQLSELSKEKPHVIKLVRLFDEKLKIAASGADLRPLTTPEMIAHMKEFGIPDELAQRKIRWMSGGQKSRLVLAAAMWTKPHLIALDEPTNYLDNETLAALTHALRNFRGGVITISHHEGFVNALAKELWHIVRLEMRDRDGKDD